LYDILIANKLIYIKKGEQTMDTAAGGQWTTLIMMAVIFGVFWLLLIRPQRKQQKTRQAMLENLKVGDRVTTIGRFYGTVTKIKDDILTIKVGPNDTELMIDRRGIDSVNEEFDAESMV